MEFIETHCHLDDDAFAPDLPQVLERAREAGVRHFINIGYEPESWQRSIALAASNPDISFTLGMHPNSADRWSNESADQLVQLLERTAPLAIGEIGLDFYREWVDHSAQRQAFRDQLELAREHMLPVIIHMRGNVETEVIATLSPYPEVRVVFHSFDASPQLRDFALTRGDFIGVGGLLTRAGSAELRDTLRSAPLEALLLETDSPYLVPRGVKERRNTPSAIPLIAVALAEVLSRPVHEVATRTTENALRLFQIRSAAFAGGSR